MEWESEDDPQNPHNWSKRLRLRSTLIINAVAFIATAASSIDSAVLMPAAMEFHVSEVAESLATAVFLIGFGIGALLASPLSELMGRYPVYLGTLAIFGIWLMASALAPNFGAQIVFRYLAGCFASAPSTTAGGSMSDIWNPMEKTWGFPIFAVTGFGGSVLGPVIDACIGFNPHNVISWRWSEWIMLITDDLVILLVLAFKQETLASQLLKYKVRHFRQDTGDEIFKSQAEAAGGPLGEVLETNFFRPFILSIEPIVAAFTLYLMITYIVLFNFLDGYVRSLSHYVQTPTDTLGRYDYIFRMVYRTNEGITCRNSALFHPGPARLQHHQEAALPRRRQRKRREAKPRIAATVRHGWCSCSAHRAFLDGLD